ncbi:hypothetical protein [Loigolactobacillus binensis]|uniref:Uncharacterized protein n=1 Tax=Loigolactobacillus binensis TaxID=2559922 RepID=A0ABW3EAC2_9LACO|nr:hypothetical protein [Loigolactobacillus binensis]
MPLIIMAIVCALIFNTSLYSMLTVIFGAFISLWVMKAGLIILLLLVGGSYLKKRLN